jgi:hypothetical protein
MRCGLHSSVSGFDSCAPGQRDWRGCVEYLAMFVLSGPQVAESKKRRESHVLPQCPQDQRTARNKGRYFTVEERRRVYHAHEKSVSGARAVSRLHPFHLRLSSFVAGRELPQSSPLTVGHTPNSAVSPPREVQLCCVDGLAKPWLAHFLSNLYVFHIH